MQRGVNRTWFFACALILLVVGVVAYNSSPANPAVFGHSASEIEGLAEMIAAGGGSGGVTFVTVPQASLVNVVVSATTEATVDVSASVPSGVTTLVGLACLELSGGSGAVTAGLNVRSSSSSNYITGAYIPTSSGDFVSDCSQILIPLSTDRRFSYQVNFVTGSGNAIRAHVYIQGYLSPSGSGNGGSSALSCRVTQTPAGAPLGATATALCASGEKRTGGSCIFDGPVSTNQQSQPTTSGTLEGWFCNPAASQTRATAYAICCSGSGSNGGSCSWKSTGSGKTASELVADGATGICKGQVLGQIGFGNVETASGRTYTICKQAHDSNIISLDTFDYYACSGGTGGSSALLSTGKPRAIICNTKVQHLEIVAGDGSVRYRAFDDSYTIFNADGSFNSNVAGASCPATALNTQTVLQ